MSNLLRQIDSLALFRGVRSREPLLSLCNYLQELEGNSTMERMIASYSAFVAELYKLRSDADLSKAIWDALIDDENPYLRYTIENIVDPANSSPISKLIKNTAEQELDVLTEIASFTSYDFKEQMYYDGYLPDFTSSKIDYKEKYLYIIDNLEREGYGIYSKYLMFKIKGGKLLPVKHPDPIREEELFCYERQRSQVMNNTVAFLKGKPAADILLYGDAGTGKSSTVKAVVRKFCEAGLRLVELPKSEIGGLAEAIELLSQIPMKFILFIDDISFESNDERIGLLKSVLEGAASGGRKNILIYCTSNRRHIVKESFSDRTDEIHTSDTMAEQLSLSDRFGLKVLFDKPNKMVYLEIVKKLCELHGIDMPEEEISSKAEAFALRAGGRSARLAKQFVDSLLV